MAVKFLRTGTRRYKRLGKGSRRKLRWRRARGRHNKIREKKKSKQRKVEIGYRTAKKQRGLIRGRESVLIKNIEELKKIEKNSNIIIGKIGKKKRRELEKIAGEKNIHILNKTKKTGDKNESQK